MGEEKGFMRQQRTEKANGKKKRPRRGVRNCRACVLKSTGPGRAEHDLIMNVGHCCSFQEIMVPQNWYGESFLKSPTPCEVHHIFRINLRSDLPKPLHIPTIHVLQ